MLLPVSVLVVLSAALPAAQAAVEITACGQTLAGSGILLTDLDCSASGGDGLTIENGKLTMNGHSIIGHIHCNNTCKIAGPGEVHGSSPAAPAPSQAIYGAKHVSISDLVVRGTIGAARKLKIRDSDVDALAGGSSGSVRGEDGAKVRSSNINGTVSASLFESSARVFDSSVSNGGVSALRVKVRGSTINDAPGIGVRGKKSAVVQDSMITNAAENGVEATILIKPPESTCSRDRGSVRVSNSVISGSGDWGVLAWKSVTVQGSQVLASGMGGIYVAGGRNNCLIGTIGHASVSNSTIDGGVVGIQGYATTLEDSLVTGYNLAGVNARTLNARNSEVASGDFAPECGVTRECADLATVTKPQGAVVCDISRFAGFNESSSSGPGTITPETWNVCAND